MRNLIDHSKDNKCSSLQVPMVTNLQLHNVEDSLHNPGIIASIRKQLKKDGTKDIKTNGLF